MTWRRSRTNAQTLRQIRRINETLRRTADARIAQLVMQTSGGAR